MSDELPTVTVVIAARPEQPQIKAVTASRALDYPSDKLEILVARGKQPSAQRNAALRAAQGDLIYFLDDDSLPPTGNLLRAASHFRDPQVKMLGGPNICPPDAPPLERVFALVLASWLAFGPSRARYSAVGKTRLTGEKELILCNLAARRNALLALGGFDESLYPNEENALMDELQRQGGKLLYDPQFLVQRRPRPSLKAFAKMLLTYGRGRAEQFRLHPTLGSAPNFVPPLFCLFLGILVLSVFFWPVVARMGLIVVAIYGLSVIAQGIALLMATRKSLASIGAIPLIVLTHVLYGLGFWRGLFTSLKGPAERPPTNVVLERIAK